jgi:transketolase
MGMAYASKYIDKIPNKFFVMIGDAESAEGQVWEACDFGASYKLDNVIAFVDANRQGQSGPTMFTHDLEHYKKKFEAFGCKAICIDGHDVAEIILALDWARNVQGAPAVIIAKTFKGKGLGHLFEDKDWHGKPLAGETESSIAALKSLIKSTEWKVAPSKPSFEHDLKEFKPFPHPQLKYKKGFPTDNQI